MKISIKLVDTSLPLPKYHTSGSVAFDLYSRTDVDVSPWETTLIPLNVIIKIPKGYFLLITARSSLAKKKHLIVANGVGVIDQDYHGDQDEIGLQVLNFDRQNVTVQKGERVAQGIFVKISKVSTFSKSKSMKKTSRGGFGSTG